MAPIVLKAICVRMCAYSINIAKLYVNVFPIHQFALPYKVNANVWQLLVLPTNNYTSSIKLFAQMQLNWAFYRVYANIMSAIKRFAFHAFISQKYKRKCKHESCDKLSSFAVIGRKFQHSKCWYKRSHCVYFHCSTSPSEATDKHLRDAVEYYATNDKIEMKNRLLCLFVKCYY